jgi:hypothetical protein
MLGPVPIAAASAMLSVLLLAAPPAPDAAPPAAAPGPAARKAPPATRPTHGEGANPASEARSAARDAAEKELLETLVPAPLTAEAIRRTAAEIGAGPSGASTVDALIQRYESMTAAPYAKARAAVRPRLAAAYRSATATGTLEPMAGPELAQLLAESANWRAALAAADAEFFQHAMPMRSADAQRCPGLALYMRVVERDDVPATDPAAAMRLTDLVTETKLEGVDRRRVEDALERHWTRIAEAIATRRRELSAIAVERARLEEQWGAAWELTAPAATIDERGRLLERLGARERATEGPLRVANREAASALLKLLTTDAADRVRDAADRTLWPWLFDTELALEGAVARASELAGPDLGEPLAAMMHELRMRLQPTHRDLTRRASHAEEIEAIVASAQAGTPAADLVPLLEAQKQLQELLARRRRIVHDTVVRMQQACATDARTAPIMDERLAALEAEARTAQWRMRGIEARLAELRGNQPADAAPTEGSVAP